MSNDEERTFVLQQGTGLRGRRKNLMVVAAAVRPADGFILTAPPPARHCDLVRAGLVSGPR